MRRRLPSTPAPPRRRTAAAAAPRGVSCLGRSRRPRAKQRRLTTRWQPRPPASAPPPSGRLDRARREARHMSPEEVAGASSRAAALARRRWRRRCRLWPRARRPPRVPAPRGLVREGPQIMAEAPLGQAGVGGRLCLVFVRGERSRHPRPIQYYNYILFSIHQRSKSPMQLSGLHVCACVAISYKHAFLHLQCSTNVRYRDIINDK